MNAKFVNTPHTHGRNTTDVSFLLEMVLSCDIIGTLSNILETHNVFTVYDGVGPEAWG